MADSEESVIDLENPRFKMTTFQHAAASLVGSVITSLIVTPLDVVKIRLQAQQKPTHDAKPSKCFLYCNGLMDHICSCSTENSNKNWFQKPAQFTGTWDALTKITRNEGLTALWSGLSPTLVLAIPSTVIYFVAYEHLRSKYTEFYNRNRSKEEYKNPFWIPGVAGSCSRVVTTVIINPLELVRTKMQSKKVSYFELKQALKMLVQNEGILGFWRGTLPHLLRDVPFSATYWSVYEILKNALLNPHNPSVMVYFISGAVAGGVSASVTTPFDVIKTHQQIYFGEQLLGDGPNKTKTSYEVSREIFKQFGWRGMFAGLVPRVIKVAPACAIMISTFEYGKIFFYRLDYSISVESNKKDVLSR